MPAELFPRLRMNLFALVCLTGVLNGCEFWDKEIVDVYAPNSRRDKEKTFYVQSLNTHLGRSKAERIRAVGPPDKCTNKGPTTEICEWTQLSKPLDHSVAYTYGSGGLATAWSYHGSYGEFTSANYGTVLSSSSVPVKNQKEAVVSHEESWRHPSKTSVQFDQDNVLCRTEVQGYPKSMWETEADKCLKRQGWTRVQTP